MITLHNGTFYTSQQMWDTGFGACRECGTPHIREESETIRLCNRRVIPLVIIRECFIPSPAVPRSTEIITSDFLERLIKALRKQRRSKRKKLSHLTICKPKDAAYIKIYPVTRGGGQPHGIKINL